MARSDSRTECQLLVPSFSSAHSTSFLLLLLSVLLLLLLLLLLLIMPDTYLYYTALASHALDQIALAS